MLNHRLTKFATKLPMTNFDNRQQVTWDMGNGEARGIVVGAFNRTVARRINGRIVTRYGSPENPAYLITRQDGGEALVFGSELRPG